MTDADLIAAFLAWREEIDSTPFAHEQLWSGDQPEEASRRRSFPQPVAAAS